LNCIVELSRTLSLDRLKKGVLGLSKLAKIFGMPAMVSGVPSQDGSAPVMIPQIAEAIGGYVMTLAGELAGDFRSAEAQAAIGVLYEMASA
jgi:hypothetical protein